MASKVMETKVLADDSGDTVGEPQFPLGGEPKVGEVKPEIVEDESKAVKLRPILDIIKDLSQRFEAPTVKTRKQGGKDIDYIPWHTVTRILDKYAGGWSYRIISIQHLKEKIVMISEISIPSSDGTIVRQATGNEDDVTSNFGDPFSNSESMSLRRAASKFGVGRYLYNKG